MPERVLEARVALVTGGGRGIGRGISTELAAQGAIVAVNYHRSRSSADEVVDDIVANGGRAKAYQANVQDGDECAQMVASVTDELGDIDILICNAGIASRGHSVVDTDPAEVLDLFATHALSAHHLARLVVPSMRAKTRGDIVMVSSVLAAKAPPGGAPYTMAKAAMEGLASSLANEERMNGIHVNVVAPGLVETDMGVRLARATTGESDMQELRSLDDQYPFGRVCQPIDVARVVTWLCSEGAGYVTGQRIECDGGGPLVDRMV